MVTTIPTTIPDEPERAVASFDWTDIASGQGYKTFYAGDLSGSYMLTSNIYYADKGYVEGAHDTDFDAVFLRPATIKGKVIVNVPISHDNVGGAGDHTVAHQITVYIRKYDGTTETDLASGTYSAAGIENVGTKTNYIHAFALEVPLTHFKIGDTLRFSTVLTNTGTTGGHVYTYYDPKNRLTIAVAAVSSMTTVDVPFKLEI